MQSVKYITKHGMTVAYSSEGTGGCSAPDLDRSWEEHVTRGHESKQCCGDRANDGGPTDGLEGVR